MRQRFDGDAGLVRLVADAIRSVKHGMHVNTTQGRTDQEAQAVLERLYPILIARGRRIERQAAEQGGEVRVGLTLKQAMRLTERGMDDEDKWTASDYDTYHEAWDILDAEVQRVVGNL